MPQDQRTELNRKRKAAKKLAEWRGSDAAKTPKRKSGAKQEAK
ncbi:MAG TPA: hypothetical protein PLV70_06105 [Flavobacteriales bacterium]|nr:hypothetical protein [Flavobacteriales bacterium]HRO38496.1 hypothetical protein [Flavobacteriales bacterium]HRP80880.1 hypothetical protein [Flavobacteriales bacterium]HRQ84670.1 hypothetical protein [Flavobacteriales bacterium]